jgi:hypothetical protein
VKVSLSPSIEKDPSMEINPKGIYFGIFNNSNFIWDCGAMKDYTT